LNHSLLPRRRIRTISFYSSAAQEEYHQNELQVHMEEKEKLQTENNVESISGSVGEKKKMSKKNAVTRNNRTGNFKHSFFFSSHF
jgi:hypothetical protein